MKRWRWVGGISRLSSYRQKSGFPLRLLNHRLNRRANRTVPNDLAEGAERAGFLGGVQGCSARALKLAEVGNAAAMVVEDFGTIEMDFAREQHADDERAHPVLVPIFSSGPHLNGYALSLNANCLFNPER